MAKKKSKRPNLHLGLDVGAFGEFLKGKSIAKPFGAIEELAGYFDAVTEFVRREYASSDATGECGFVGFINEEIRARVSKNVNEIVSRNRFGSSFLEVLIPFKESESEADQEMRKLFYHTQFRKTMKASQAELAHSLYSMLEPRGIETLLTKYGTQIKSKKGARAKRSQRKG